MYLILTVIELHSGFITQILQDIPLLINLMTLMKTKIEENDTSSQIKLSMLSLFFVSLVVHNQDQTFDLITLLEKNVGLSFITSYAVMLINHAPATQMETNEDGDVNEDAITYSQCLAMT